MTVSAQTTVNSSAGNGVTTVFPYAFKILRNADLEVLVDGVVQTLTTHYTVSGAGSDGGGDVTFVSAPASGAIVVRRRNMQFLRSSDFQYQGDLPNTVINADLDAPVLMAQQLQEQVGRSIRGAGGESFDELPVALDRLDRFPAFHITTGELELSSLTMTQLASAVNAAYAAGSTADAVTFTPAGTGAVARSVQAKLRDMPGSAGDYGTTAQGYTAGGMFSPVDGADSSTWLWTRKLTGAHAIGAGTLTGYTSGYHFDILTDDADVGADFMVGFRVRHMFGGSATKGGREALSGTAWLTAATHASNANRNYVGVQGKVYAQDDDNGTNTGAGALGAIFGIGGAAYAYAAATNLLGIEGAEFNTFTEAGSSAKHMAGISIVGCQATRGATIDAGIRIGAQAAVGVFGPHIGWKWGMVFTDENGADPLYSGSTLIGTQFQTTKTILRGIDLSQFTMTEYILRGIYSKLTEDTLSLGDSSGFSTINIAGASTNASLVLAGKGTGSVYFRGGDGTNILRGDRVASSVNYVAVTPAVTTGSPALGAVGSDTNIDLQLQGKGTGLVRYGTHTGSADVACNGYITIRDAAGNTRKLMTTA